MPSEISQSHERGARNGSSRPDALLPTSTWVGLVIAVSAVLAITIFSYRSLQGRNETASRVAHTLRVIALLEAVHSTLTQAETGQRGFLLTGEERYAAPYFQAESRLRGDLNTLASELQDPVQRQLLGQLRDLTDGKLIELRQTMDLHRTGAREEALRVVRTDRGKAAMDTLVDLIARMQTAERGKLEEDQRDWQDAVAFSGVVSWSSSGLLVFLIVAAAVVMSRDYKAREVRSWLQLSQVRLAERLQGEQRLSKLGDNVLQFLAPELSATVGSVYLNDGDVLTRVAGYALPNAERRSPDKLQRGEGLLGQVAKNGKRLVVREVPPEFAPAESGAGRAKVRELVLMPASVDGQLQAVLELGFFRSVQKADLELLEESSHAVAVAVRSSRDRSRLEELLEETQRQAEELQAQQEELRVSNEELEEQGRVLKESQTHLENSQAELEQTNAQLEEQAALLESQRDALSEAQEDLLQRAEDLERSNQYKSEFLANMSHELRTPLNSSLILAKILADNKDGNLSAEQVKFAQTITSAGNDLLALINDILDLAKIEAGKVELNVEEVPLAPALDSLVRTLKPLADQKGLEFSAKVEPGTPPRLLTDAQRLSQILKNLLANALKFTERGSVALRVHATDGQVRFDIRDTGIGIAPSQHAIVFEAFRQADGSTHRKYGGTGLGLSIARDLARRLGGDISLESAPGQGSTFTLVLPERYTAPNEEAPRATPPSNTLASAPRVKTPLPPSPTVEDDRAALGEEARVILIIEDDLAFSSVLRDLAHELGFRCVIAQTAAEGLAAADTYRISAIILDMHLPDHSGLGVLDQLKRNPKTRHIPVHVASVDDYSREALELGAIGYALKPVKREELVKAIQTLERKFSRGMRRVLVVEDDERQRESVRALLSNGDVEIVGVATGGRALKALQEGTFDCMVMDLNLPDLSGYELLEEMSSHEGIAFPPVIVYTGRTLSSDEEQRLRRFSKSIIIKDARSPERLLDEVTLFLHQMEATLPPDRQRMLKEVRKREVALEGRTVLIVEDDVRNVFALTSLLEPKGLKIQIARNGKEALACLEKSP